MDHVREILNYKVCPAKDCVGVADLMCRQIGAIELKINSLNELRRLLAELVVKCPDGSRGGTCKIIEQLGARDSATLTNNW